MVSLGQRFGELCQVKRVAHIIGDGLDLGLHVVMRENHRIALRLEGLDPRACLGRHGAGALKRGGFHSRRILRRLRHDVLPTNRVLLEEVWHCTTQLTRQVTRQQNNPTRVNPRTHLRVRPHGCNQSEPRTRPRSNNQPSHATSNAPPQRQLPRRRTCPRGRHIPPPSNTPRRGKRPPSNTPPRRHPLVRGAQRGQLLEVRPHALLLRRVGKRGLKAVEGQHATTEHGATNPGLSMAVSKSSMMARASA